MAWHLGSASSTTHPSGGLSPNTWGIGDMIGNVAEWCADGYADYPTGDEAAPALDPVTWAPESDRVTTRGGGWKSCSADCRAAARSPRSKAPAPDLGFRLARTLP